jgi:hypothetical protein
VGARGGSDISWHGISSEAEVGEDVGDSVEDMTASFDKVFSGVVTET